MFQIVLRVQFLIQTNPEGTSPRIILRRVLTITMSLANPLLSSKGLWRDIYFCFLIRWLVFGELWIQILLKIEGNFLVMDLLLACLVEVKSFYSYLTTNIFCWIVRLYEIWRGWKTFLSPSCSASKNASPHPTHVEDVRNITE